MPRKGFKSLTIPEKLYEELKKYADKTHRTVPKTIEYIFEKGNVNV
jgi:hypothetical protein